MALFNSNPDETWIHKKYQGASSCSNSGQVGNDGVQGRSVGDQRHGDSRWSEIHIDYRQMGKIINSTFLDWFKDNSKNKRPHLVTKKYSSTKTIQGYTRA